jgi:hypothetical protein
VSFVALEALRALPDARPSDIVVVLISGSDSAHSQQGRAQSGIIRPSEFSSAAVNASVLPPGEVPERRCRHLPCRIWRGLLIRTPAIILKLQYMCRR